MDLSTNLVALGVAAASVIVSFIALVYVVRGDRRKSGLDILCDFAIKRSIDSAESWVSFLTLQNEKDRSVTIYEVFMELGPGVFVSIEDRHSSPITLGPYEAYHQSYDPVYLYDADLRKVTGVFRNSATKEKVVLVTSFGRYYPRLVKSPQSPISDILSKNHWTAVIHPLRVEYKGSNYGSTVQYFVTLTDSNGEESVVPIYPRDHEIRKFANFSLTKWSMSSA